MFGDALRFSLSEYVMSSSGEHTENMALRGQDELTTGKYITAQLMPLWRGASSQRLFVTRDNSKGDNMALVTLTLEKAEALLAKGYLEIDRVT